MTEIPPPAVVVIGGGITGLVAARRVRMRAPEAQVVLLEADERLGGKIRTDEIAGVPIEAGADWFLTRQPAAVELCRELGLEDRLVAPDRTGALVWSGGRLRRLIPELVRGVPTKPFKAMTAGLLSPLGALRASADLFSPSRLDGADISIGSLVRRRFGNEVMERLVDPLLAASRSGSADEMSLAAAAPEVDRAARSHRSVTRGLRAAQSPHGALPSFLGVRGGMKVLLDALTNDLRGVDVHMGTNVTRLEPRGPKFAIRTSAGELAADAVICAVPASTASQLVEPFDGSLAADLATIEYAPAIVLSLVYPADAGAPPSEGSGMLVPSGEGRLLTACAWFSEKWGHARPPDGSLVLRCFVGRSEALSMTDAGLVDGVASELRDALHLSGPPSEAHVTRWPAALPVYRVGHLDLIDAIEARLERHRGLTLAGAGYRGSGLPDCISQGERAADTVMGLLGAGDL